MAGLSAGIVTEVEANTGLPGGKESMFSGMFANPATWSFIWAGLAFLYLVGIYLGTITIRKKG